MREARIHPQDESSVRRSRAREVLDTPGHVRQLSQKFDELTISHVRGGSPDPEIHVAPAQLPRKFGEYLLRQEVGRGGMGVVYKAYRPGWDRVVALKCLKLGELASSQEVQRFQREAQAVAHLDHPNIVSVLDVGSHDSVPYLAMPFIEGETLSAKLKPGPWAARASAQLMSTLSMAVAYAHQRGVIHRDLKPSNILIETTGEPKITDFGLAKQIGPDRELTISGDILGTPNYIPPEQAAGRVREIGPAADIYALGAILYCLLTGRPPFSAGTFEATLKEVIECEPIPPHRLNSAVPAELETICLKCLEKSPSQRYLSAALLAEDLQRFLEGLPITARPTTMVERAWRWCHRNPLIASLLAVILVVTILGVSTSLKFAVLASTKATEAEGYLQEANSTTSRLQTEQASLKRVLYHSHIQQAYEEWRQGNLRRQTELLNACDNVHAGWEYHFLRNLSHRGYQTWSGHTGSILCLAASPNGEWVASGSHDQTVRLWDVVTGREVHKFGGHSANVNCLAFSRDGHWLVSGSSDKTVRVWDLHSRTQHRVVRNFDAKLESLAITPDGERLVVATASGSVKVLQFGTFAEQVTLRQPGVSVHAVAISPDGKLAAAGFANAVVRMWDLTTGVETEVLTNHEDAVMCLAFDSRGKWLARGAQGGVVKIWNRVSHAEGPTLQAHWNAINTIAFSEDGQRLVSGGSDNLICEWEVDSGALRRTLRGHQRAVTGVVLPNGSQQIVSCSDDVTLRMWESNTDQESTIARGHTGWVNLVAVDPTQKLVASTGADNSIRLWELATGTLVRTCQPSAEQIEALKFSRDGQRLMCVSGCGNLCTINVATGEEVKVRGHEHRCAAAAFSDSLEHFVTGGSDKLVTLWNTDSGQKLAEFSGHTNEVQCLAMSSDARLIASGSLDKSIRIWDVAGQREKHVLLGHTKRPRSVAFDTTGTRLVSASDDLSVRVWDVETGRQLFELLGHSRYVRSAAFSPNGQRIVSGSLDTHIKLWDAYSGEEILALRGHRNPVQFVAFSPDGRRLLSGGTDQTVRIWDAGPAVQSLPQ